MTRSLWYAALVAGVIAAEVSLAGDRQAQQEFTMTGLGIRGKEPPGGGGKSLPLDAGTDDDNADRLFCSFAPPAPAGPNQYMQVISCGTRKVRPSRDESNKVLSAEQVSKVAKQNSSPIRQCYADALTATPNLSAKITVELGISPDGDVTETMIHRPTNASAVFQTCITEQLKTWKFPKPADGRAVNIVFPLFFGTQ